ncbi:MAG: flagellar motor switch protein FliG [Treponema sp.]|nr:flagellar motor switch protein FliG [Treponema sp.]
MFGQSRYYQGMKANDKRLAAYQKAAGKEPAALPETSGSRLASEEAGFLKAVAGPPLSPDTIYRRVAKFLLLIGTDHAAKVLSHFTRAQTEKIIPEIASIRRVAPEEASDILGEFQSLIEKARESGGVETARTILEQAFGEEKAGEVLDKAVPFRDGKPFEYLDGVDGEHLYLLLRDELPATQCLVLSRVNRPLAAAALGLMDKETQKNIIRRMAKNAPVAAEIVRMVDQTVHEKLLASHKDAAGDRVDGRGALAEILKKLPAYTGEIILANLSETDPALAAELRSMLFTADDVASVADEIIQKELFSLEDKAIAKLIAGKTEPFREKILTNVSRGRSDRILEEEELGKPFRRADCTEVTEVFISNVRREWGDGRLA